MASGYGVNGGPSRCFPFWQEMLACYALNTSADDTSGARRCVPALEDYEECLHHRKEKARVQHIQAAYRRHEAKRPQDSYPTANQVRSLGLLGKDEESMETLGIMVGLGKTAEEQKENIEKVKEKMKEYMEQEKEKE